MARLDFGYGVIGVLLAAGLAAAAPPAAAACFEPAPEVAAGASPYAPLPPTALTADQQRAVRALFARLAGRWTGEATGYFCDGTTAAPRRRPDDNRLAVEIELDDPDSLVLHAHLSSPGRNTDRIESLRLYLRDGRLRVDAQTPAGDTLVRAASPTTLDFLHKAAPVAFGDRRTVHEVARRLVLQGGSLRIEYRVYSQGGLSAGSVWTLTAE